ncbi:uncharacterized protein CPUR_08806 [Claviceps purpurea 20.1]|uniref:Uncharacterized protein n=1 Tax=Claviceps purpurea (strain 20.1) TaxID=1111077 RepID=M1VZE0_CLAP2|nr:uncharacterized protein CPUR_08806 [Claviceps purpurea 20.1]
MNVMFESKTG